MILPPVALVHGMASSFELNWRQPGFADVLADAGRQVVPVDLPGHGTAPRSHDPADYADLAGALDVALPDGPLDVVGFSLGAITTLRLAARRPDRFRKIVVAGIAENVFESRSAETVAAAIESGRADGEEGMVKLFVQFSRAEGNDPLALAACFRRQETPLTPEDLAVITSPVLVVLGDRDFVGSPDRLLGALPDARLVMLKGVEHFATPRDFAFWDATIDFLAD